MKLMLEKVSLTALGSILIGMLFSGCGTTSEPAFTSDPSAVGAPSADSAKAAARATPAGFVFQVGDTVTITFSDTPSPIAPHEERVREDGKINPPLIDPVKAVGKTPGELQKELHDLYVPKYYIRLTVTVKYSSEQVSYSVLGEVNQPGPKQYHGLTTVTKAIGAAGGLTDFASRGSITLTRANGTQLKINYNKAIANPKDDPQVFPGDSINVKRRIF